MNIPVLIKILVIFLAVVFASARRIHLGLAAALGGLVIALWSGLGLQDSMLAFLKEAFNPDTIFLLILMSFIMAFSSAMKKSGIMDKLASSLQLVSPSPKLALALAPLLIGTLPMPGGAVLSAPLVDSMDKERNRSPDTLSAANYWFRHILELSWPLYPAFILTSSLSGIKAGRLIMLNLYAPILLFLLGLLFILPSGPAKDRQKSQKDASWQAAFRKHAGSLLEGITPLAVVIILYAILDMVWRFVSPALKLSGAASILLGRYGPIYSGLALGSFLVLKSKNGKGAFKNSINMATWRLIGVILGIRIFSALLGAAGVAEQAADELYRTGIPAILAVAVLPFVAGMVTGVGFGYVGLAFPIIIGLASGITSLSFEALIVFSGAFGYAGMMLSPLHVCMVVSAEHFKVGLASIMKRSALPLSIFVILAIAYSNILSMLLS